MIQHLMNLIHGENPLPSTIQPGTPTTLVWNDNDFGEETLSVHGTINKTNGISIQNKCPWCNGYHRRK